MIEIKRFAPRLVAGMNVFKITDVEYKKDFGRLSLTLVTENGGKLWQNFDLENENGMGAFSGLALAVFPDLEDSIDETQLVGQYVKFEIEQVEYEQKSTGEKKKAWNKTKGTPYLTVEDNEKWDKPATPSTDDDLSFLD